MNKSQEQGYEDYIVHSNAVSQHVIRRSVTAIIKQVCKKIVMPYLTRYVRKNSWIYFYFAYHQECIIIWCHFLLQREEEEHVTSYSGYGDRIFHVYYE